MVRAALIALALIAGCAPRNEGVFGQFPQEPIANVAVGTPAGICTTPKPVMTEARDATWVA